MSYPLGFGITVPSEMEECQREVVRLFPNNPFFIFVVPEDKRDFARYLYDSFQSRFDGIETDQQLVALFENFYGTLQSVLDDEVYVLHRPVNEDE